MAAPSTSPLSAGTSGQGEETGRPQCVSLRTRPAVPLGVTDRDVRGQAGAASFAHTGMPFFATWCPATPCDHSTGDLPVGGDIEPRPKVAHRRQIRRNATVDSLRDILTTATNHGGIPDKFVASTGEARRPRRRTGSARSAVIPVDRPGVLLAQLHMAVALNSPAAGVGVGVHDPRDGRPGI